MKAVGYTQSKPIDHDDALIDFEMEKPRPAGHDLLVRVQAISVNPVDQQPQAVDVKRHDRADVAAERAAETDQKRIFAADRVRQLRDVDHAQEPGEEEDPDHQPVVEVALGLRGVRRQEARLRLHDQAVDDRKHQPLADQVDETTNSSVILAAVDMRGPMSFS
jgi:hypothetical protein